MACRSAAPSRSDRATSSAGPTPNRCANLAVPWLGHDGLKRWTLPRRCLPDETMDLRSGRRGALVLRYGQTTTHTVELTRDHLITGEAGRTSGQ